MELRRSTRVLAVSVASGALIAVAATVAAVSQPPALPTSASTGGTTAFQAAAVPKYQEITSGKRSIPRGQWVDLATYGTVVGGPVTHTMSFDLDLTRATGSRPYYVKVSWVRDKGRGWDRTGSQIYAVPRSGGDDPFHVTHEHTIAGVSGKSKAQVYIQGSGSVPMTSSVIQAIAFPAY